MQEMRVLYAGYQADQQVKQDQQNGVEPSDRAGLKDFNQRLNDDTANEGEL